MIFSLFTPMIEALTLQAACYALTYVQASAKKRERNAVRSTDIHSRTDMKRLSAKGKHKMLGLLPLHTNAARDRTCEMRLLAGSFDDERQNAVVSLDAMAGSNLSMQHASHEFRAFWQFRVIETKIR